MINVAIVGLGYIGKVHLRTLLRIPGVNVVALAGRRLGPLEELAAMYNIPKVTADYRTLLDDPSIDVVHNCTPNHLHYEVNHAFISAGKHILSEKPLGRSAEETGALAELAEEKDVLTAINFCYRYYPAVQEAAVRIRQGELGSIYTVMGSYLQDWLLFDTDYDWRLEKSFTGESNVIGDIGSHWFHLAQFIVGSRITEVMSDLKTTLPVRKKPAGDGTYTEYPVQVEDYGSVLVHFANGASGVFTVSQLAAGKKCAIDVQVYGSQSSLRWNHERPTELWLGRRDRPNEVLMESPQLQQAESRRYALLPTGHPMGYHDAVFNLFTDFYSALHLKNQGKKPEVELPDFREGHRELLVTEAILRSHREKRWIRVEE
ncbi:MAG: Gfo/Idh/MocA family protein [Limnochordia bacterium]|jgi:predicted dehydrogenase